MFYIAFLDCLSYVSTTSLVSRFWDFSVRSGSQPRGICPNVKGSCQELIFSFDLMERQRKENRGPPRPTDSFIRIDYSYARKGYDISNKVSNKDRQYISYENAKEEHVNSIANKLNHNETSQGNKTLPLRILYQSQQLNALELPPKPPVRTLSNL